MLHERFCLFVVNSHIFYYNYSGQAEQIATRVLLSTRFSNDLKPTARRFQNTDKEHNLNGEAKPKAIHLFFSLILVHAVIYRHPHIVSKSCMHTGQTTINLKSQITFIFTVKDFYCCY